LTLPLGGVVFVVVPDELAEAVDQDL